jgi:hypothetical protein
MGSRARLDTGEDTKVVPLSEIHLIFVFVCPSRMLVTTLPELSRIDFASCHEERKKCEVRRASALKFVYERIYKKGNNNRN